MRIYFIAVGDRMPGWVQEGYQEYAKRLPPECGLHLIEIAPGRRGKGVDVERTVHDEGERMLAAIPRGCRVFALDVLGRQWSTEDLSQKLAGWMQGGCDVALLVGGPEGLSSACRQRAEGLWSLSLLTLPHPVVRIVVAEQLYRAWSILKNHPYHRK